MEQAKSMTYVKQARWVIETVENIEFWRDKINEGLKRGGGGYDFDDVLDRVISGQWKLICLGDAYFIMQIAEYPQHKAYHVFCAGGNIDTLIAYVPELEKQAREYGCQRLALNGRMGWWKTFKDKLPVTPYLTLTMEVSDV